MNNIILALEQPTQVSIEIVDILKNEIAGIKVNHLFLNKTEFLNKSNSVIADLKLYDVPKTMGLIVEDLIKNNYDSVTIHLSNGLKSLEWMVKTFGDYIKLIGVSFLTSFSVKEIEAIYNCDYSKAVKYFTSLAIHSGFSGIVCAPFLDIDIINEYDSKHILTKYCPGIRIKLDDEKHGHSRSNTPKEAIKKGANYLIIGSPILNSKEPLKTINEIKALYENQNYI